jgi:hypothetical protein
MKLAKKELQERQISTHNVNLFRLSEAESVFFLMRGGQSLVATRSVPIVWEDR